MMLQLVNGVLTTPNLDEDHGKGWILQAHLLPSLMIWIAMEILLYKARRIKTKIPRITLRMMAVIKKWKFNISDKKSQRYLHQRIKEHKGTAIKKQPEGSAQCVPNYNIAQNLKILRKCQSKLGCLIFEILF